MVCAMRATYSRSADSVSGCGEALHSKPPGGGGTDRHFAKTSPVTDSISEYVLELRSG